MLTLITGTPGAGKTLYAVAELASKVPGSTVEGSGGAIVQRRLLTNIRDLTVEHEHITAADLDTWHTWAQPGDVIVFDEVQEVWRPRGLGTKVPECIAALETHRHKGVDIVLITQHPMLVDPNIRRLVNQHLHLRRLAKSVAYVYEWDHCSNPGQVKTALQSRVWFHPKRAYQWYKSAQLHTKPTARIPRIAFLGLAALAGLAYMAPTAYGRLTERLSGPQATATATAKGPASVTPGKTVAGSAGLPASPQPVVGAVEPGTVGREGKFQPMGCITMGPRCECFGPSGERLAVQPEMCTAGSQIVGYTFAARDAPPLSREAVYALPDGGRGSSTVPPSLMTADQRRAAAAAPQPGTVDDAGNKVVRQVSLPAS